MITTPAGVPGAVLQLARGGGAPAGRLPRQPGPVEDARHPGSIRLTLHRSSVNELLYFALIHFQPVRLVEQAVTDYATEVRVHVDVTLRGILSC